MPHKICILVLLRFYGENYVFHEEKNEEKIREEKRFLEWNKNWVWLEIGEILEKM